MQQQQQQIKPVPQPMEVDSKHPPTMVVIQRNNSCAAPVKPRLTTRYGTKYEKSRLEGEWATRISNGEDPGIDLSSLPEKEKAKFSDPLVIAKKALKDKTMPLGVRRFLPDGTFEDWFLDELVFDD